jgi:hypothetical protein
MRAAVLTTLWRDQFIAESLVVPLAVVVRHKLVDSVAQTSLPEENESIETLFGCRSYCSPAGGCRTTGSAEYSDTTRPTGSARLATFVFTRR